MPSSLRRSGAALLALLLSAALLGLTPQEAEAVGTSRYVAPWGDNSNLGTFDQPWETIQWGVARATPGDTIYVRGGTYREGAGGAAEPGTRSNPITLRNYPGEQVLLKGALRFTDADWWIVDGIDVTDDPNRNAGSLVAFRGGSNWVLRNSTLTNTRGTSNLLIYPSDNEPSEHFTVTNNCIRGGDDSGQLGTDHNIYLFPGADGAGGVIERNIIYDAPNGANIKIGGPSPDDPRTPANVTIRYNTLADAASSLIFYRQNRNITVERNLISTWAGGDATYNGAVIDILSTGSGNTVTDNAWHGFPKGFRVFGGDAVTVSGHRKVDPGFGSTTCGGFRPTDEVASLFGRYAKAAPLPELAPQFTDTDGSVFADDITWLAEEGITAGCNPPTNDEFCPNAAVTRGQMAAFLVRALGLDASSRDRFGDDDDSVFERDVQALAAAGITAGCNPPTNDRFCPDAPVTRGAMAAFLVRALDLDASSRDRFGDDDGSIFERDVQALAAAGITAGCNPPENTRFCPNDAVTRGAMAAFLKRALG